MSQPTNQPVLKKRRPTQADVAQLAGVSQTAVSLILNKAVPAIPDETRQRVLAAAQALGYVPDRAARGLRTNKSYTIASIIPSITNPFYPAFERGIQDVAEAHEYNLVIYNSDGNADKEARALLSAQQSRVDGLIVVLFQQSARSLLPLVEQNMAVVRLESQYKKPGEAPLDNIYIDNIAAAQEAVTYLLTRGHRRIGVLARNEGPGNVRVLGYQQALAAQDIPLDETLVQFGAFTEEGGYEGMQRLLALHKRPTAVFAANDMMALGAMLTIQDAGLNVPADIAVVGFDDIPAARLVNPPLTTVAQFQVDLGRRAAELLFERLNGTAPPHGRTVEMPYQLVIRKSA
ncbi:MAG: LacI family transcriptional regulator [Chloroflexi bacterium]|nr:MAG: LacI family transcriptional regulator [Chloroflexota bacterium]